MKKMKKIVSVVMILSVVIACGVLNTPQVVMASQKSDALSAYKVFLKENKWDEGEAGTLSGKYFGLKDLNGDKIPELIINQGENKKGKRAYAIFTYNAKEKYVDELYCSWLLDECYYNSEKKYIIDKATSDVSEELRVFKNTKKGNYKDVMSATMQNYDGKYTSAMVNGKKASYKKTKSKIDSYLEKAKLIKTPYKINSKNIKKYVK